MGKVLWFCAVVLGVAGCASPQIMINNLPLAGGPRGADASIAEVSLQEIGVSGRDERILFTRVSIKNRTGKTLRFGPQHVYLVDESGTLFLRISERWLLRYYEAGIRGLPAAPTPEAIVFPSAETKLGDALYRSTPLTAAQKGEVAEEMARLVKAAFVRPQRDAPGTFLDKGSEVTLGVPLKEMTLQPGRGMSGYVYFYHPKARKPQYPLRLITDLQDEVHAFLFRER